MYYTYVLENSSGKLYIGQTDNIESRLARHNNGASKFTRNKGPWILIYKKGFGSRSEAVIYERSLKSLKSSKYIRESIVGE